MRGRRRRPKAPLIQPGPQAAHEAVIVRYTVGRDEPLTDTPVSKARVVAGLLAKPPAFREEETAPATPIGLSGSRVIEPKKP